MTTQFPFVRRDLLLVLWHKKDVGTYLVPVLRLKALALPDIEERATSEAHADMRINPLNNLKCFEHNKP